MSKQKKISSFFLSSSSNRVNAITNNSTMKRTQATASGKENAELSPRKRQKPGTPEKEVTNAAGDAGVNVKTPETPTSSPSVTSQETPSSSSNVSPPTSPPLSPEQATRVQQNKLQAEMKLMHKTTEGLVHNISESWFQALRDEFSKPYFLKLSKFVASERKSKTIFPPVDQVFSFTNMSEIQDIKVVILGQDPYHGPNQAHGLCFSVQRGVPPPPSLVNMYKELSADIEGFKTPDHGYLGGWAQQGVLLLNAVLTVQQSQANSHKAKGWENFTDAVITHIDRHMDDVVFILWGGYAQKKGKCINKKKHHVITGTHPSPLSAHRGFFGCKHFSKCNDFLQKKGKPTIDWAHLPLPDA